MTATRTTYSTSHVRPAAGSTVLFQDGATRGLSLLPRRRRDALRARLMHNSLDRRLAAGAASHGSRLLAVRAAQLLTPRSRSRLAGRWDQLAIEARHLSAQDRRRGIVPGRSRAETVELLDSVAAALRADRMVLARGVALAATTLGTAANALGPLHDGGDDVVAAAARAAVAAMSQPARSG